MTFLVSAILYSLSDSSTIGDDGEDDEDVRIVFTLTLWFDSKKVRKSYNLIHVNEGVRNGNLFSLVKAKNQVVDEFIITVGHVVSLLS